MDMAEWSLDIVGIGNAIVDVLARVDPAFLRRWDMHPGTMALIDAERAAALSGSLAEASGDAVEMIGGGSVANSCVVAARLGARVAYLGKVGADRFGEAFVADLERQGVACPAAPLRGDGADTGRCVIAVTPDGQRTMNTFLGAATSFAVADLDRDAIAAARFTYLEGYLFDPPGAQDAFRAAAAIAHAAGRQVAISLSDAFCVGRHRDAFRAFVRDHADIVFGNEEEFVALCGVPFEEAVALLATETAIVAGTRGAQGSVLVRAGERVDVAAVATDVVDTTGAGDAYAAGVLTALARGDDLADAGRLGSLAAAHVIARVGARPGALPLDPAGGRGP